MPAQPKDIATKAIADAATDAQAAKKAAKKAAKAAAKANKPKVLRWKGIISQQPAIVRRITAIILAVAIISMVYTQLGFVGIGLPGHYTAYAIVILVPVAVAALLFGPLIGMAYGLFAGVALQTHAIVLPLDYYEMSFVTPLTSIFMLLVAGFFFGIFFALALRKNPGPVKRAIYIVIIGLVLSALYSVGFITNVIVFLVAEMVREVATDLPADQAVDYFSSKAASTAIRLGSGTVQALVDAVLICGASLIVDAIARKMQSRAQAVRLRSRFAVWLSVVVLVTFMITSAISFVAISVGEQGAAAEDLKSEVDYLTTQLEELELRSDTFMALLEENGIDISQLSDKNLDRIVTALSIDHLLEGYSIKEDGVIVITIDDVVVLSNLEAYESGLLVQDVMGPDMTHAMDASLKTHDMQRFIFDEPTMVNALEDEISSGVTQEGKATEASDYDLGVIYSQLAFLLTKKCAPAEESGYAVTMIRPADMVFADRARIMGTTTLMMLTLMFAVFFMVSRLLNIVVAKRIDETNSVLARVASGDLDARVETNDTHEFESLANGINGTVGALQGLIAEAETRMDEELATAKAIQESALPRVFPPYPDNQRFDLYALMHAAREVGGDFYDFFLVGDECTPEEGRLCFLVADVSGKGVPAALFMMNAKALIRGYIENGIELGEAVENANRQLCETNDAGMFVTVWVGVLDYKTLHIDYVNAGHNPPLLWQNASWHWMTEKSGLPLGLFADLPYKAHSFDCAIGDQMLIYSDGVTEAMSTTEELYGEERLEKLVSELYDLHPRKLVEAVRTSVARFARGAEQSDDITILCLEVGVPPEITATLTIPADDTYLPKVNDFIHTELDRRLCPLRVQHQLDIAVEELFVNVAHYAYPDATEDNPGTVRVSYTYSAEPPSIVVDIIDDGIPYNPLEKPDAVTPDNIEDVPIGGLGILMAKRSVDEMTYKYEHGSNVVSITKKW